MRSRIEARRAWVAQDVVACIRVSGRDGIVALENELCWHCTKLAVLAKIFAQFGIQMRQLHLKMLEDSIREKVLMRL